MKIIQYTSSFFTGVLQIQPQLPSWNKEHQDDFSIAITAAATCSQCRSGLVQRRGIYPSSISDISVADADASHETCSTLSPFKPIEPLKFRRKWYWNSNAPKRSPSRCRLGIWPQHIPRNNNPWYSIRSSQEHVSNGNERGGSRGDNALCSDDDISKILDYAGVCMLCLLIMHIACFEWWGAMSWKWCVQISCPSFLLTKKLAYWQM